MRHGATSGHPLPRPTEAYRRGLRILLVDKSPSCRPGSRPRSSEGVTVSSEKHHGMTELGEPHVLFGRRTRGIQGLDDEESRLEYSFITRYFSERGPRTEMFIPQR
jgi:hypothetical protein